MLSSGFLPKCKSRGPLTFIPLLLVAVVDSYDIDEGLLILEMTCMSSSSSSSSTNSIYTSVLLFFPS
ncbi:hypothetical protein Fmac_029686 [Flemingia macrophylla]|uniref:Secreted protein n=1 Tax=Flemingia macrophylla TaxID=520843 RepID=A0ABD1LB24_9FABA